jgi:hypothetical protein
MFRNLALWKKLAGIGTLALLGLTVLFSASFVANRTVTADLDTLRLREEQLARANDMQSAQRDLLLAGMDAIIDRADGDVSADRLKIIQETSAVLRTGVSALVEDADTGDEVALAGSIRDEVGVLTDCIEKDLVALIRKSGAEADRIAAEFERTDDALDRAGDSVKTSLEALESSLRAQKEKRKNAREAGRLIGAAHLSLIQVQQWLTDISATRGAKGFDDGFDEAEKHAVAFRGRIRALQAISPALKKVTDPVLGKFESFYEKGKHMAKEYISGGPEAGNAAMALVDGAVEDMGESFGLLTDLTRTEIDRATAIEGAVVVVNHMGREHLRLMLAAMDSIIDRASGRVDEERLTEMKSASDYMNGAMDGLAALLTEESDKAELADLRASFEKLERAIRRDLVTQITIHAGRATPSMSCWLPPPCTPTFTARSS